MTDFLGNELNIGDEIAVCIHSRTSSDLVVGIVQRFTTKYVGYHKVVDGRLTKYTVKATRAKIIKTNDAKRIIGKYKFQGEEQ